MLQGAGSAASPRVVWLATGVAWALSSASLLASPTYWNPSTALDWLAVLSYTLAWLLLAPALVLATRLTPSRSTRLVGFVLAGAAAATGLANFAENGLGLEAANELYVTGILIATILLVPLAYLFARDRSNWLAIVAIVLFLGIGFASGWLTGLLVLAAFVALAVRTDAFLPRRPAPAPELELVP